MNGIRVGDIDPKKHIVVDQDIYFGLLETLKDSQAIIKQLAEEGRYFDDLDKQIGLEGKIDAILKKAEVRS